MRRRKTKLPNKVKIKETDYKVVTRSENWHKKQKAFGKIHYDRALIEIAKGQDTLEMVDTLIHEIFHGIIRENPIQVDGRKEERFVRELSKGLTNVLLANPTLIDWIHEQIKQQQDDEATPL